MSQLTNHPIFNIKTQENSRTSSGVAGFVFAVYLPGLSAHGDLLQQSSSSWQTVWISIGIGLILLLLLYILLLWRMIRHQNQSLKESEETFKRFFMTSRDPVFITSRDGRFLDSNQAMVELFGFGSREELMSTPVSEIYHFPEDRPRIINEINRAGFVQDLQVEMVDKDQNILNTFLTATAIIDENGMVSGYQGTIRDNTGWIKVEQEMEENKENLDLAITGTGAGLWDWDLKSLK